MLTGLVVLAAAGAEASGGSGLPQLNPAVFAPQLIWLAISFAALFFIMSKIALPRIGQVIDERRRRIQRDLDEAERLKGETEKALAAYEEALAEARAKAHKIASETRDSLGREVEAKRQDVERQIADKLVDAERRIAETKAGALSQVNDIAVTTAQAVVSKLIGKEVSGDDVRQAIARPAGE
ncbi:MAG: hypothetical protein RLZ98_526 [Pseudomonadota bacterium]